MVEQQLSEYRRLDEAQAGTGSFESRPAFSYQRVAAVTAIHAGGDLVGVQARPNRGEVGAIEVPSHLQQNLATPPGRPSAPNQFGR